MSNCLINRIAYPSGLDFWRQWVELELVSLDNDWLLGELRVWGERPITMEQARA